MTNEEYIRKAVELADGWEWKQSKYGTTFSRHFGEPGSLEYEHDFVAFWLSSPDCEDDVRFGLDALAAQLVRQVDAISKDVHIIKGCSIVLEFNEGYPHAIGAVEGEDRAMNTMKVIVDSKVLEQSDE